MDYGLMVCRTFHFAASLVVVGILVFQAMVAPKALAADLDRPLKRLILGCAGIAAVTSVIWLSLLSATLDENWTGAVSPSVLGAVLFGTQFGAVWQWHMAASFGVVALVWLDRRLPDQVRWPIIGVTAALQVATLGLVGHAVMLSGAFGLASRASQVLHLLAAGFWLGSLVPVVLCLRIGASSPLRRDAMLALTRFSNAGYISVLIVVVTGVINIWLIEGHLTLDLAIPYQQWLAAKIMVVATMIALAVTNRYWLVPRLRHDAAALDQIRRICILVFCLGLGAVALVSVFGTLSPN